MKKYIGRLWLNLLDFCSLQMHNIYAGMMLSFIVLMLASSFISFGIGLIITPLIVAFLGIYLTSKYLRISPKIMFTNIKKYMPKNSFFAMMLGCLWALFCAACI